MRRCLKCQARKTSRQTVCWPVLPIPLPNSPGFAVSVDYFGPLPITARGNLYILLFTDRFSRRAGMFAVTTAEFTVKGTANILMNRFIPLWGCPSILLSDNGPQFCARLVTTMYKFLGIPHYGPNVSHGLQRKPKYAYNNSVSAATGLVPNEVHIGRLPRPPPSPYLIDRTVMPIRTSTSTNLPIAVSLASVNNGPANLCENSTPSPLLG